MNEDDELLYQTDPERYLMRADALGAVPEPDRRGDPGIVGSILDAVLRRSEANDLAMRRLEDEARGITVPYEPGQPSISSRQPSYLDRLLSALPEGVEESVRGLGRSMRRGPAGVARNVAGYMSSPEFLADLETGGIGSAAKLASAFAGSPRGFLFDTSDLGRAIDYGASNARGITGGRPERYIPARGAPEYALRALDESNVKRLVGIAEEGMRHGGQNWYDLQPIREAYESAAGPQGLENFRRTTQLLAATSPRAKVNENIRRATYFNSLLADAEKAGRRIDVPLAQDVPRPFGHLAHKTHTPMLAEIFESGRFTDPIARAKAFSFAENLYGNLDPATVDTHNLRSVLNLPASSKRGVADNAYAALEDVNVEVGNRLGIKPAAAQSAIWVGDAARTNVANPANFSVIFDDMARYTANQLGMKPSELLEALATGRVPLLFDKK